MTGSNANLLIEREIMDGKVGGVHFGADFDVIIRSPDALLGWLPGHGAYISRGSGTVYQPSALYLLLNRRVGRHWGASGGRTDFEKLIEGGGLLGKPRVKVESLLRPHYSILVEHFGEEGFRFACDAAASRNPRQTAVVDGGGLPPCPGRRAFAGQPFGSYESAYRRWRDAAAAFEEETR